MKKGDLLWLSVLAAFTAFLVAPTTHKLFVEFTSLHPYMSGFIKFSILATMGELLALRIVTGNWKKPNGLLYRALIWGFLGMLIVLMFENYTSGVSSAMSKGLLPFKGVKFVFALLVSTIMNLTFAPVMMAFHRITDTYIDMKYEKSAKDISFSEVISRIDWNGFISFVIAKTIPFFWIPAHTITFMLPGEYRVLVAAMLSIALGAILAFAKKRSQNDKLNVKV